MANPELKAEEAQLPAKEEEPDVEIDEQGVEDAEIIDDEDPDPEAINKEKAKFELKKLEAKKEGKVKNPEESGEEKCFDKMNADQLREELLCVSCCHNRKCMLI